VQQVQGSVTQFHLDAQLRIQRHEARYQWHDEALAVGHGAGHAQQPLGLTGQIAHRPQRFLATVLQPLAVLKKGLPGFAQGYAPGAAIEQSGLQALFKPGDLPADVR